MNADDKKSLWILAFLLILLVGFLIAIRGCNKKEQNDDLKDPQTIETTPSPTPKTNQPSEEENISTNVTPIHNVVDQEKVEEVKAESTLDLAQYFSEVSSSYQVELGDDSFLLPQIEVGNGMLLKVEYYLKGLYEDHYYKVSDFDIGKLGTYKIVYTLSYKGQSYTQEAIIDILDTEAPIVEGMIENYDPSTGITSYEPVRSGSKINRNIQISFRDNHEVSYAEYYKAKYEKIDDVETIEQEGMQEIIEIDLEQQLILYEDGEYHIRVYDFSSNVTEYIVTIDRTNPIVQIQYFRIDKDHTSVTIESQEELQAISGWSLSENHRSINRIYANNQHEEVTVYDLAGNPSVVTVETTNVSIKVHQGGVETSSINLNTNEGEIKVVFQISPNMELRYSVEQSQFVSYQNEALTTPGHYTFQVILDGRIMDSLEFDISNVPVGD